MRDFYVIFGQVRWAGTMVMRSMALLARMKLLSNMVAPGIEPVSCDRVSDLLVDFLADDPAT